MRFDEYDFAKPFIGENEVIRWKGKPKGLYFTFRDFWLLGFGAVWCLILLTSFYDAIQKGNKGISTLMIAFMLCVGFGSTVGRMIYEKFMLFHTAYVITDKKLIRKRGRKIDTLGVFGMPDVRVTAHKNGNGTIRFGYLETRRSRRRGIAVSETNPGIFSLENIPDVAKVQQIIYEIMQ